MGISTTTFDPLRKYVNVRLQQGVPLIDADWNELDDIRKFEVRAFLKWFVGDGVPAGSDAFRIEGTGDTNNFRILSGVDKTTIPAGVSNQELGLRYVGNCLVDGLDVTIRGDMWFTDQAWHASKNPSAQLLAETANGGVITALTTPTTAGTLVIYLDVWERLITVADDPTLALPGIGIESCARIKREWAVRVDTSLPAPGAVAGHSYYELAALTRRANDGIVNPGDIADKRTTRLTLSDLLRRVSLIEQATIIPAFDAPVHPDSQFSPTSGNIGTTITLHGRNFLLSKPRVFFGSVEAPVIATINSNTFKGFELTANVPSGVTAESKITVQTDGGTAISDSLFTVIGAPSFAAPGSQFTPTGALPGQQVTLTGSNFNGNNLSVVLIPVANATDQGIAPASVTPNPTGTQITITIPTPPTPAGYGLYHIRVSTAAGVAPSDDAFTLEANPPTFAAPGSQFSPPSATVGIPVTVTLVGNHFDALPLSVAFTPASGSPIPVGSTLVDASHITISTAGVTNPGSYKITVTTPGGSKTSDDAFNMRAKGKDGGKDGKDGAKDIVKEGAKEGVKEGAKEAAVEKVHVDVVTPVRPLEKVQIDAKIADALNPVLPHNAISVGNGSAPPAVGHAFISMAERPDVESHVLLQADGHSGD
jgi:IPT/TIG domain-containing protein/uncharacterized protein DUF6519